MDNRLPIVKEVNAEADAALIFEKIRREPYSFLLESSMVLAEIGEYSFLGCDPFLIMSSKDGKIEIVREGIVDRFSGNPLVKLDELLARFNYTPKCKPFPFNGGAVGFFSYDLGREIEALPADAVDDLNTPDICLGFYDVVVVIEHLTGKVYISSTGHPLKGVEGYKRAAARLGEVAGKIGGSPRAVTKGEPGSHVAATRERLAPLDESTLGAMHVAKEGYALGTLSMASGEGAHRGHLSGVYPPADCAHGFDPGEPCLMCENRAQTQVNRGLEQLQSNFTPEQYMEAVQKAREYIRAGDIFEVNMTQRFQASLSEETWEVYKRLRETNRAPFGGYLNFGDFQVLSSSPERFVKVQGRKVETRPIKGTRPRGNDAISDEMYRRELLGSEKDKAELMMIVDLERNDLGRICEIGSVRVPDLVRLEEYVTVFHLVSTVEGKLLPGKNVCDLLAAAFPGGSITGAPKIRSMEIIEELEGVRRGIYTGSIGYIDFNGDVDLNIVIRTIICRGGKAYFQVGGAITVDSDPQSEYYETLDKAKGIMKALGFTRGELNGWKI